ncbi:MAG: hypothetical protein ACM362_10290 [Candidatus Methylomirabilota bacterium]
MLVETTISQTEVRLGLPFVPTRSKKVSFRPWWVLSRLALTGLLLVYLAGWLQDLQRVRSLEAEPTPPSKVITKYQAWERIYPRLDRPPTFP